ncbi:hypothetical protein DIPPA_03121 [Diplonema papillatum]|nr:hypothetical protein DIPPA_03121 [Diplonema papillatum]
MSSLGNAGADGSAKKRVKLPKSVCRSSEFVTVFDLDGTLVCAAGKRITVRRHASDCLRAARAKGVVVLWAAASQEHVSKALSAMGATGVVDYVVNIDDHSGRKDLSLLGVPADRRLLVDCAPCNVEPHATHSILVPPFFGDPFDSHLAPLLRHLRAPGAPSAWGPWPTTKLSPAFDSAEVRYCRAAGVPAPLLALAVAVAASAALRDSRILLLAPVLCVVSPLVIGDCEPERGRDFVKRGLQRLSQMRPFS